MLRETASFYHHLSITTQHDEPNMVVVLPDGLNQIVSSSGLNSFFDLKCRLELQYGLPCELQRLFICGTEFPVGDWVPLNTLTQLHPGERVVFVRTERNWIAFISACLRQDDERVLQTLDFLLMSKKSVIIVNRIFVALLISLACTNTELIRALTKRVTDVNFFNKRTASGRNLLHFATNSTDWECTELILKHANSDLLVAEDISGQTPFTISERSAYPSFIRKLREYHASQLKQGKMTEENKEVLKHVPDEFETCSKSSKEPLQRHRGSQSLKSATERRQLAAASGGQLNMRSRSTPTSPLEEKPPTFGANRLLTQRTPLRRSLKNPELEQQQEDAVNSERDTISSTVTLPTLDTSNSETSLNGSGRSASNLVSDPPAPKTSPARSLTLNLFATRERTQSFSAPTSPNILRRTRHDNNTPDVKSPIGLRQVAPPWRKTDGNKFDVGVDNHARRNSAANAKSTKDFYATQRKGSLHEVKNSPRPAFRSMSVACHLTTDDIKRLDKQQRLTKPWNEWRRLSVVPTQCGNVNEMNTGGREAKTQSFEEWFLGKEAEKEANLAKMSEDEQQKALEKKKLEKERRMRCKTHEEWLFEKEIQSEITKEEEKEKMTEVQLQEMKIRRKAEAEKKYEKWMREKYEEELRKEEELDKLMREKWKLKKQQEEERRKSIFSLKLASKSLKRPLKPSKSLPLL
eukprot:gene19219-21146_t